MMKREPAKINRTDIKDFLLQNIHRLDKPSTYLGREINSRDIDWDNADVTIILYMPVSYSAAINNLGVAILYNWLNDNIPGVICERGYMPESKLREILIDKAYPVGFSLETKHGINNFDCIGFSCYFELQFLNIVYTLHYSGIPVYSDDRLEDKDYPIIIMGGVAAYSPSAVEEIVDIVFIGDGEEQMELFANKLKNYKKSSMSKTDFLLDCAKSLPGCYVPRFYHFEYTGRWIKRMSVEPQAEGILNSVTKACYDINKGTPFYKQILPESTGLQIGYGNVEIARGCYNSCRFCMASAIYKPYREFPIDRVKDSIEKAISHLGCNDITPQSLNYSSYSQKHNLLKYMFEKANKISSASQRMDTFSPVLAKTLYERGTKTATFAIEGGSQRMRNVINKEITQKHIEDAINTLIDLKYMSVKIYMISGLPFEEESDRIEILRILEPLKKRSEDSGHPVEIKLSYTQFTAKPFTALQWADVSGVLDTNKKTGWG